MQYIDKIQILCYYANKIHHPVYRTFTLRSTMSSNESTASIVINDEQKVTTPVEKKMRVVIERHPDPEVTSFHFTISYTEVVSTIYTELELVSGEVREYIDFTQYQVSRTEVDSGIAALAQKIFAVSGVIPYIKHASALIIVGGTVIVSKSRGYDDESVERGVIQAVAEHLGVPFDQIDSTVEDRRDN
jgi:hypothetical protein